jgi:ankyrin repeat protein
MSVQLEPVLIDNSNESENENDELTFHNACAEGNLSVVKIYLAQQGFYMNVGNNNGDTGFHLACRNGNLNVVQFILQKGFDITVGNHYGDTGFHGACFNGHLNVVQFLLQEGFDMNTAGDNYGSNGVTMLINDRYTLSSDELFMPCLLLLIESGAQLNEDDLFEELISAIQIRYIEITFMKKAIFEKWTRRIAQAITDFTIHQVKNTSLQNLSQVLWIQIFKI